MNKDIKTLIEEASKENHKGSFNSDSIWLQDQSFQAGASFALSLFKWRKFTTDKLPEIGDFINVRQSDDGNTFSVKLSSHDEIHYMAETFIEWMPITSNRLKLIYHIR